MRENDVKLNQSLIHSAYYLAGCFFLLLSLPLWATLDVWLRHEENITRFNSIGEARNLSIAFEEHVKSVIENADRLLRDLREDAITNEADFHRIVREEIEIYRKRIIQLSLIDSKGRLTYSSLGSTSKRIDLKDREHFKIHKENPSEDNLYVSKPVLGRLSGIWTIQLTRPILNNGSFEGVIVLSIPVSYFTDFFEKIDIGKEGLISLIGFDGAPRVAAGRQVEDIIKYNTRALSKAAEINSLSEKSGYYYGVGLISGRPVITAYRKINDAHLNVLVEISESEILAPYYRIRNHLLILASAATALIFLVTLFFFKSIQVVFKRYEHLKITNRELTDRVTIDSLTQVKSRGSFYEDLQLAFSLVDSRHPQLGALVIDIDHFKDVNDFYGHPVGDLVLKEVASICKNALREHDIIGRLGGEEFGVILAPIDIPQALGVAEKIRRSVEEARINTPKGIVKVTISIGVACVDHSIRCPDELVERADDASYEAKRSGRNKVSALAYETM